MSQFIRLRLEIEVSNSRESINKVAGKFRMKFLHLILASAAAAEVSAQLSLLLRVLRYKAR
jgi:hypothetical protein